MTSFPLVIFFHQNLIDKNHKTCCLYEGWLVNRLNV